MKTILVEYADLNIYYTEYKSEQLAREAYIRCNELEISCQLMTESELDALLSDAENNKCASDCLCN